MIFRAIAEEFEEHIEIKLKFGNFHGISIEKTTPFALIAKLPNRAILRTEKNDFQQIKFRLLSYFVQLISGKTEIKELKR